MSSSLAARRIPGSRQLGDDLDAGGIETEESFDGKAFRGRIRIAPCDVVDDGVVEYRRSVCRKSLVVAVGRCVRSAQQIGANMRRMNVKPWLECGFENDHSVFG